MSDDPMRIRTSWAVRLLGVALSCAFVGAPRAAQVDGAPVVEPAAVQTLRLAGLAADGEGAVTPIRDPRIVTTRLPAPAPLVPTGAPAGAGTMLLSLGILIAWIAGRRR
ncbi:MAG: hypothetical protein RJA99_4863 [Pseudomonadota bacterium]